MNTEFAKIETLYERDDNFKVVPGKFKNRVYATVNPWHWTEKIDGTNIRIIYSGPRYHEREPGFDPVKIEGTIVFRGRTDNGNMPGRLLTWLQQNISLEKMNEIFQSPVVLYGEGYGAGIQKGGGYTQEQKFILFDVLVDNKWWLDFEAICDVAAKLKIDVVPSFGVMTIEEATERVKRGFPSALQDATCQAEGLVGRPLETLFDKKSARLIVKLKTKDF